eukprot:11200878-Lingulodinium_polyedra.AAC.1
MLLPDPVVVPQYAEQTTFSQTLRVGEVQGGPCGNQCRHQGPRPDLTLPAEVGGVIWGDCDEGLVGHDVGVAPDLP